MADKTGNILVIEDNRDVLDGIIKILEYCGYRAHGEIKYNDSVCERIKAECFDMIILDVMLSGTDGRELAKKFKNIDGIKEIPILMISAYQNLEESVKAAGADDFLKKPFGLSELREKVLQIL